jgi:hypothetical protein
MEAIEWQTFNDVTTAFLNQSPSLGIGAFTAKIDNDWPGPNSLYLGDDVHDSAFGELCDFAQGYVIPPSIPDANDVWLDHSASIDHSLVYVFSGWKFNDFPLLTKTFVSDDGDQFCPNSCDHYGPSDIIGLAEGIGGLGTMESIPPPDGSCENTNKTNTLQSFVPAYHAVAQMVPKREVCSDLSLHCGYVANEHQRMLLMLHELGHVLGATHDKDPTLCGGNPCIMYPTLIDDPKANVKTFPLFSDHSAAQIAFCVSQVKQPTQPCTLLLP